MFKDKKEFFLWWLKHFWQDNFANKEHVYRKRGIIVLFAYCKLREYNESEHFIGNIVLKQGVVHYVDENGSLVELPIFERDDVELRPWFRSDEEFEIPKGFTAMAPDGVKTTYGEALANFATIGAPFNNKVKYVSNPNGWLKPSDFYKNVAKVPRSKDGEEPKEGEITPEEFWRFVQVIGWMQCFNPIFGVAATEDTLKAPKEVTELADKLFKEAFDKGLDNDPVHMAWVEKEITSLDMKLMQGKPGAMFLRNNGKAYGVSRKKMYIAYGTEGSIEGGGKVVTIRKPLVAGVDLERLPEQANTMRAGIAGRGLGTALGGAEAKKAGRATQSISFSVVDCNSTIGMEARITEANHHYLKGRYLLGSKVAIKAEDTAKYIGKEVSLRSPMTCKAKEPLYCKVCMGDTASRMENSASLQAMTKENVIMNSQMAKMHGKTVAIIEYDPLKSLH